MTRKEFFYEAWDNELGLEDKIVLVNNHLESANSSDDQIFPFDESFWEICNFSIDEAIRAWSYGGKKRICSDGSEKWEENRYVDPYIRFNGYGNLVTMDEYECEEYCDMYKDEVFDDDDWEDYIDKDDWDCTEWVVDEFLTLVPFASRELIEKFIQDGLTDAFDKDADEVKEDFDEWYEDNWLDWAHELLDEWFPEIDKELRDIFACEHWQNAKTDRENLEAFEDFIEEGK